MARLILWKVLVKPKVALLPFQIGLFAIEESIACDENFDCENDQITTINVRILDILI